MGNSCFQTFAEACSLQAFGYSPSQTEGLGFKVTRKPATSQLVGSLLRVTQQQIIVMASTVCEHCQLSGSIP